MEKSKAKELKAVHNGRGGGTPIREQAAREHLYKILVIGDFGVGESSALSWSPLSFSNLCPIG